MVFVTVGVGCRSRFTSLDPNLVLEVRRAAQEPPSGFELPEVPDRVSPQQERRAGSWGEVILGELIAVFPGLVVPGLGHRYAGDYRTANQLLRVGGTGLVLSAVGGGLAYSGFLLDEEDQPGFAYSFYGAGGVIGVIGVGYLLVGWGYDIIDTPRAVLSGGRPPPRSKFVESLDIFGD
jgi:hypothetical protein